VSKVKKSPSLSFRSQSRLQLEIVVCEKFHTRPNYEMKVNGSGVNEMFVDESGVSISQKISKRGCSRRKSS
jgi:hypothetical protein